MAVSFILEYITVYISSEQRQSTPALDAGALFTIRVVKQGTSL